jgi:hypothetical protein
MPDKPPTCEHCGEIIRGPACIGVTFSVGVPGSQCDGLYHPACWERQQEVDRLHKALSLPV